MGNAAIIADPFQHIARSGHAITAVYMTSQSLADFVFVVLCVFHHSLNIAYIRVPVNIGELFDIIGCFCNCLFYRDFFLEFLLIKEDNLYRHYI